ncbi:MAG: hypothetical protein ACI4S1_16440, partial [Roseburia sp.]
MADGSIRIETSIDTKGLQADLKRLEKSIEKSASEIESLRSKMNELGSAKIPTQEYEKLENSLEKYKFELESLIDEQNQLQKRGFGKDIDKSYLIAYENVKRLKNELERSIEIGDKDAYLGIEDRLNKAKSTLQDLMAKEPKPLGDIAYYYSLEKRIQDIKNNISSANIEMQKLANTGKAFALSPADKTKEYEKAAQRVEELTGKMSE